MFTNLGVLVHLGLSGVGMLFTFTYKLVEVDTSFPFPKGQTASEWWAWELVALAASMYALLGSFRGIRPNRVASIG